MYFNEETKQWKEGSPPVVETHPIYGEEGLKGSRTTEKYPSGEVRIIDKPKEVITTETHPIYGEEGLKGTEIVTKSSYFWGNEPRDEIRTTTITPRTVFTSTSTTTTSDPFKVQAQKAYEQGSEFSQTYWNVNFLRRNLFSGAGTEYITMPSERKKLVIEDLANELRASKGVGQFIFEDVSKQFTTGAVSPVLSYAVGSGVGSVVGKAAPFVSRAPVISNIASFITRHPTEIKALGVAAFGGVETWKASNLISEGKSSTYIAGEIGSDVLKAGLFSWGFKSGLESAMTKKYSLTRIGSEETNLKTTLKEVKYMGEETYALGQTEPEKYISTRPSSEIMNVIKSGKIIESDAFREVRQLGGTYVELSKQPLSTDIKMSDLIDVSGTQRTFQGSFKGVDIKVFRSIEKPISFSLSEPSEGGGSFGFTPGKGGGGNVLTELAKSYAETEASVKVMMKPSVSTGILPVTSLGVKTTQKGYTTLQPSTVSLSVTKQTQRQHLVPASIQIQRIKSELPRMQYPGSSLTRQFQETSSITKQLQGSSSIQLQQQESITRQIQKSFTTTTLLTPTVTITRTGLPPLGLPDIMRPSSFGRSFGMSMPKLRQKKKYRPSLYGIMSGIRVSRPPSMSLGIEPRYAIGRKRYVVSRRRRRMSY